MSTIFFAPSALPISATITANLSEPLMVGQTGNTLICVVSGGDMLIPTLTYQWTRNDETTPIPVGSNTKTLTLSPLRFSNAGVYNCSVTVSSNLFINDIMVSSDNTQRVTIQSK